MNFLSTLQKLLVPALFVLFYVLEPLYFAVRIPKTRQTHIFENLKLVVINVILLAAGSSFMISLARGCEDIHFGLLHLVPHSKINPIFILAGIFLFDFVNYGIHRLYHSVDFLWSIHRVHHTDSYIDVSSSFRFHPLESLFRIAIQTTMVGLLGISPFSLAIYGVIVTASLLWSHSNIEKQKNKWWDRFDKLIVMPDVHRLHHSTDRSHHDNNYGISFIIWDRMLGTYLDPKKVKNFEVGLKGYNEKTGFMELIKDPLLPSRH